MNGMKVVVGFLFIYLFYILFRYTLEQIMTDILFKQTNYYPNTPFSAYAVDNLYFGSLPIISSTVFWMLVSYGRLTEHNASIIEEQKNTEIKFLKAQINPHFIFNTLNNIYSMVYFQSDKSLPAIEKLSHIMRFTTYEAQKDYIKLSEEIAYIKSYLELEQLRHEEQTYVAFKLNIENDQIEIPPYLLSPFVENAIKHGYFSDASPLEILLTADAQSLNLRVANEIGKQKKDKFGGIGLENLKRRLQIYYPKRHLLQITQDNNQFIARLEIDLR
jgi:two-component system LytT family sensor kinase